jgi:uncharacterized protein (DUF1778 family)
MRSELKQFTIRFDVSEEEAAQIIEAARINALDIPDFCRKVALEESDRMVREDNDGIWTAP